MKTLSTLLSSLLSCGLASGQFTLITNDAAGDAGGELDGTALHFWYEQTQDLVTFRVTCANLASFSTGPAADFSFGLPNGMDGGFPAGAHWTTPGTPVHKIASIYADPGGIPPGSYSFNTVPVNIVVASNGQVLCASSCASLTADVANNHLYFTFNREDIISDTEMGGSSATIVVVANIGHDLGWDDNISATGTMTLSLTSGIGTNAAAGGLVMKPNPCEDQLTVDLGGLAPGAESIEITDLSGRIVRRYGITSAISTLDVSTLRSGVYLTTVRFADRASITNRVRIE